MCMPKIGEICLLYTPEEIYRKFIFTFTKGAIESLAPNKRLNVGNVGDLRKLRSSGPCYNYILYYIFLFFVCCART